MNSIINLTPNDKIKSFVEIKKDGATFDVPLQNASSGYNTPMYEYSAYISQDGANFVVNKVVKNNCGRVNFIRGNGVGSYVISFPDLPTGVEPLWGFTSAFSTIFGNLRAIVGDGNNSVSMNTFAFQVVDVNGAPTDDTFTFFLFELKVTSLK